MFCYEDRKNDFVLFLNDFAIVLKDGCISTMSVETVYIVCMETLIFILLEGGLLSLIIDNWQNERVGFVIFYISNVASFLVMGGCCAAICQGYVYKPVMLVARAALIFNVVVFCSFLFTASEWSAENEPHAMHALLFKTSTSDSDAVTVSYLVTGISLSAVVVILHFCVHQQLLGTFAELRTESRYKVYTYINRVVQLIDDEDIGAESASEQEDAGTETKHRLLRILKLASDVRDEQQFDTVYLESWRQLLQLVVRALLIVLCILYDMKACMETDDAFFELAPSLILIASFVVVDCVALVHKTHGLSEMWTSVILFLLVLASFAYLGLAVVTAIAYISNESSIFLSDTRKTSLNNVLFVAFPLDAFLCVYGVIYEFLHHDIEHHEHEGKTHNVHSSTDETHVSINKGENRHGPSHGLIGSGTILGFATGGPAIFNVRQVIKKNK